MIKAIIKYLKDWKNILAHSIIGIAILLTALYLPIEWYYRVGILIIVIIFNLYRMKSEKTKETREDT